MGIVGYFFLAFLSLKSLKLKFQTTHVHTHCCVEHLAIPWNRLEQLEENQLLNYIKWGKHGSL